MFDLEYKGGNTIVITSKKATVVFDPKLSVVGLKDFKVKESIVVATEPRFLVNDENVRLVIHSPGEYEVADFTIRGIAAQRHIDTPEQEKLATVYRVECGDIRLAVIGNVDGKLTEEQYEAIGVVDVVVVPVGGGGYTLDAISAAAIVRSIEPKVVVPIHYAMSGVEYEVPQDSLEVFTKELGIVAEQAPKLKLKSAASLPQSLTIIELARS